MDQPNVFVKQMVNIENLLISLTGFIDTVLLKPNGNGWSGWSNLVFQKIVKKCLFFPFSVVLPEHLKTGASIYYELVQCDRVDIFFSFAYPGVSLF